MPALVTRIADRSQLRLDQPGEGILGVGVVDVGLVPCAADFLRDAQPALFGDIDHGDGRTARGKQARAGGADAAGAAGDDGDFSRELGRHAIAPR